MGLSRVGSVAAALAVATAVVAVPAAAWARFTSSAAASVSVGSASLAVTDLATSKQCKFLGITGDSVTVSWSANSRASYTVTLTPSLGQAIVRTTTGSSVTVNVSPGLTYTVGVTGTVGNWTATATPITFNCSWLG